MKPSLATLFFIFSVSIFAQNSFKDYLEVGEPASLAELAKQVMNPNYEDELKTNSSLVEGYVSKAQDWSSYSTDDLTTWKSSIQYLMDMGYSLSENKKEMGYPLFYLTSPNYTALNTSTNQYKLHTSLFELGAASDYNYDGTYFTWAMEGEAADSPILKDYFIDFKGWTMKRKRNWLFPFFAKNDFGEMNTVIEAMIQEALFDVNLRSKNGKRTLFDEAIDADNIDMANLLLDNGFIVNKRCFDCNGETSLHRVVINEELEEDTKYDLIVKMISKGGDPDLRDFDELTPIHLSIKNQDVPAFKAFMQEEVEFVKAMLYGNGKKELNYLEYYKKHWSDDPEDDLMGMLMEKTDLNHPPTKEEVKAAEKKEKEEEKAKKKAAKGKN